MLKIFDNCLGLVLFVQFGPLLSVEGTYTSITLTYVKKLTLSLPLSRVAKGRYTYFSHQVEEEVQLPSFKFYWTVRFNHGDRGRYQWYHRHYTILRRWSNLPSTRMRNSLSSRVRVSHTMHNTELITLSTSDWHHGLTYTDVKIIDRALDDIDDSPRQCSYSHTTLHGPCPRSLNTLPGPELGSLCRIPWYTARISGNAIENHWQCEMI